MIGTAHIPCNMTLYTLYLYPLCSDSLCLCGKVLVLYVDRSGADQLCIGIFPSTRFIVLSRSIRGAHQSGGAHRDGYHYGRTLFSGI